MWQKSMNLFLRLLRCRLFGPAQTFQAFSFRPLNHTLSQKASGISSSSLVDINRAKRFPHGFFSRKKPSQKRYHGRRLFQSGNVNECPSDRQSNRGRKKPIEVTSKAAPRQSEKRRNQRSPILPRCHSHKPITTEDEHDFWDLFLGPIFGRLDQG